MSAHDSEPIPIRPVTDQLLDNARSSDAGQSRDVERVRWHVRNGYAAIARGEVEAGLLLLADADRLLVGMVEEAA